LKLVEDRFGQELVMEVLGVTSATGSSQAANARSLDIQAYALRVQTALGPKHLNGYGMQGRVTVAFSVSNDGALTGARVAQSSGQQRLDAQALEIVGRAALPAPPTGMSMMHRSYVSVFTFS
jgi:TonB family protein